jgi:hypothetical protein
MRVISQWQDVDVDYESNSFAIAEHTLDDNPNECCIMCFSNDQKFVMAKYSTFYKAHKALVAMSTIYTRYLITDNSGYMTMTDGLECELDKPFNRIDIKKVKTTVYQFPQEEDL